MEARNHDIRRIGLAWMLACAVAAASGLSAQADWPPRAPVSLFDYDRSAPLEYEERAMRSPVDGVRLYRISYASPGGGRATGLLAVPWSPGPHAGIIAMHGMPGSAGQAMGATGIRYAQRGAVVLAINAPWARAGRGLTLTPRDSAEQVQLMQDLQRGLDILEARDDVDPSRLGYLGTSYGGGMGALFAGLEPRLRLAVLRVGGAGLVSRMTDHRGRPTGGLAGRSATDRERWLAAMMPIEPRRFVGEAEAELLFMSGRSDPLVPPADSRRIHEAAPESATVFWYDAGHGLTPQADLDMARWVAERLGTAVAIERPAMPAAAPLPADAMDRARILARWFRTGRADSLVAALPDGLVDADPARARDLIEAVARFSNLAGEGLPLAEQVVWRNDVPQYWQTLETAVGDTVVLRLVLVDGGVSGWGWQHPLFTPPGDSAGVPAGLPEPPSP